MAHRDEGRPRAGTMLAAAAITLALTALPLLADETILLDDPGSLGRRQTDPWAKAPGGLTLCGDGREGVAPPAASGPIPYRQKQASMRVKGLGDRHACELDFSDAQGADQKLGFAPLRAGGRQQVTQDIPQDWPQPLTLRSITWHNWGLKGAGGRSETGRGPIAGAIESRPLANSRHAGVVAWRSGCSWHRGAGRYLRGGLACPHLETDGPAGRPLSRVAG